MRRREREDHVGVDVARRVRVRGHDVVLLVRVARPEQEDGAPVGRLRARRPHRGGGRRRVAVAIVDRAVGPRRRGDVPINEKF